MNTTIKITLRCQMKSTCGEPVSMIDRDGYVYCETHGLRRRGGGTPCRKLRPAELKTLLRGEPIRSYS